MRREDSIQAAESQLPLDICRCRGLYYDNTGLEIICAKRTLCERYLQYETGRVFAETLCSPIETINHFDCFIGDL